MVYARFRRGSGARRLCLIAAIALLGAGEPAQAGKSLFQTDDAAPAQGMNPEALKPLDEAERRVDAAWAALPFGMRRTVFVSAKAPVFGAYAPRPDATFKPGETLLTYIEPLGYAYQPDGDGFQKFGLTLDFDIAKPDGTVLAGKKAFLTYAERSRVRLKELMLNASLDISGAPEGAYVLHWTLHDSVSGRTSEAAMPFTIAK